MVEDPNTISITSGLREVEVWAGSEWGRARILSDDFVYPANLTCEELLAAYSTVQDTVLIGDGVCNRGPLNTPNCGYDGGDCCSQTCVPGGKAPILGPQELYDEEEIRKWTNDSTFIAGYNSSIPGLDDFGVPYRYSCSPFTFDCRDPTILALPLNCSNSSTVVAPEVDTNLNETCGDYMLDPEYGDGFCDERFNYLECGYDGGDCCVSTCALNRLNDKSCTVDTFNCRDPRSNDTTHFYVNPPLEYQECRSFYYEEGFSDLRLRTAVTIDPNLCVRRHLNLETLDDVYVPTSTCPGNFTLERSWTITDTRTSAATTETQTVHISTTIPPPYDPRPVCLWRNASRRAQPYSFGLLQTSPFFGFGDADLCTVTVDVAFVACSNLNVGSLSTATCDYLAGTDELVLSHLEDGDVWNVTVRLTDSCLNENVVSTTVAAAVSSTPMPMNVITADGVAHPCVEASPYEHAVVTSRLPLLGNRLTGPTAQVCTELTVYEVPMPSELPPEALLAPYQKPPALKMCMAVTRAPAQCAGSAGAGRLSAIFLDTVGAFNLSDPSKIAIVNGSVRITDQCKGQAGLAACNGVTLDYAELETPTRPFNLALLVDDTTWVDTGDRELGCFFLEAFDIVRPVRDLDVALVYSDVDGVAGRFSIVLNRIATDTPPSLDLPNLAYNVIANRITPEKTFPSGLACVGVEPRIIDESTTALCLRATTQYPGCASSSASGSLHMIYLDTHALGLADPRKFTFESGNDNITVLRPYCVRRDGSELLDCTGAYSEPPRIGDKNFLVALPVDPQTAVWNHADQSIGCLYVTHPDLYQRPLDSARLRNLQTTLDRRYRDFPLALRFTTPSGPSFMGGLAFSDTPAADAPSIASQCPRNTVFVRSPQGDNEGLTTQVCTAINVQQIDYSTLEMCLAIDSSLPQCVSSSTQGRLEAVFFDSTAFGGLKPNELSVEDGNITLDRPLCTSADAAISLTRCRGGSVGGLSSGGINSTFFNAAFTVANNVTWSGTRSAQLGCFYIKRFDGLALTVPPQGWSLGFAYSGTDGGRTSVSAAKVCTPEEAPVAQCKGSARTVNGAWKGLPPKKADPDAIFTQSRKVCTDIEVTQVDDRTSQVCLSVTTAGKGCQHSATAGTLAGIFFHSKPWAVQDARQLNIENGTIQFKTPYCTSRIGHRKAQSVHRCGAPSDANSLRLGKVTGFDLDVGLTVANTVSWSGTGDQSLGCFYITGPEQFAVAGTRRAVRSKFAVKEWNVGLRFQDVLTAKDKATADGLFKKKDRRNYSIMLGKLCGSKRK